MKRVQRFAILSTFLVALVFPLPAQAVGAYDKYIEWYADATETELVGWRYQHCEGSQEAGGYQTAYRQTWYLDECAAGEGGWIGTPCPYEVYEWGYACPADCIYCF